MKASKVIERLQKLIHEHGDKNVMFHGPYKDDEELDKDSHVGLIVAYDAKGNSAKGGNCDHFYMHVYGD